jgi:hypothetical protein
LPVAVAVVVGGVAAFFESLAIERIDSVVDVVHDNVVVDGRMILHRELDDMDITNTGRGTHNEVDRTNIAVMLLFVTYHHRHNTMG